MKLLLALLLLSASACAQMPMGGITFQPAAGGTITPVGTPACSSFAATSSSGSISYTPHASGDQLCVAIGTNSITATITSVADNGTPGSSTYTHGSASWPERGPSSSADEWCTLALATSVTSITVHTSINAATTFCVSEYSGAASLGASPNQGTYTSSPGSSYTATITTGVSGSYGICSISPASSVTATATAGTIRDQLINPATPNADVIQDETGSTSLTLSGTLSPTGHSGAWVCDELHP